MSGTVAQFVHWFGWKQRMHHLVDVLNVMGWRADVFSPRSLTGEGPVLPAPNRMFTALVPPGRTMTKQVVRDLDAKVRERLESRWVEADADLHIHGLPPLRRFAKAPKRLLYECMDDWAAFPGADQRVIDGEKQLCEQAERIWCVSRPLRDRLADRFGAKVEYVPNGADFLHFSRAVPLRAARRPGPRVLGYVGVLQAWFDVELVREVALRLKDWRIELVGPSELSPERRARLELPNIHFAGRQPYEKLPEILADFDVAMIPFQLTELIRATSPIKLYEYLSAGLPVVSSSMPEVLTHAAPGIVACADEAGAFADAVVAIGDGASVEARLAVGKANGWEARFRAAFANMGIGVAAAAGKNA